MSSRDILLELKNICYEVDGRQILHNISILLAKNEFKVITGPSGCGKSTLLKIAASLIAPTSGDICLNGKNINEIKPEYYRRQVSYCFQSPQLFGETVMDNLRFPYLIRGDRIDNQKIIQGLNRFHLDADSLYKKIDDLSGGEKQRIALLRNLQYKPDILLLDEVTSALDEENKHIVHQIIDDLNRHEGVSVMWITHNSDEIQRSDNVLTMALNQNSGMPHE